MLQFPPTGTAYRDNTESHVLWRWIGIHAPDLVVVAGSGDAPLAAALAQNAVAFVGKILSGRIGGWLAGMGPAESWALGMGLNGRGIMELVVARIGLSSGLIGSGLFSVLVLMGMVTTIVTPTLLKRAFAAADRERAQVQTDSTARI